MVEHPTHGAFGARAERSELAVRADLNRDVDPEAQVEHVDRLGEEQPKQDPVDDVRQRSATPVEAADRRDRRPRIHDMNDRSDGTTVAVYIMRGAPDRSPNVRNVQL